jgi:carbon-monoxide dehydrogenase medium subunit
MILNDVAYHRPSTIAEAISLKARHGDTARYWAGGTDLFLLIERRGLAFEHCIDLSAIADLNGAVREPDALRIGAMTSLAGVERAARLDTGLRIVVETVRLMCTPQTRTLATIGGNMCHAAPSADLSPALIALDAEAIIVGPDGERTMPLWKFFEHVNRTALRGPELLAAIRIPLHPGPRAAAYRRVARTVVDIALVSSGCGVRVAPDGRIADARIVLGAVAPVPIRAREAESMLEGQPLDALRDAALMLRVGESAASASLPITDIRGSDWYRRRMCAVLTVRALDHVAQQIEEAA